MIRVLVAEDFGLLREDLCETLGQQEDMEVAGSAASGREIESRPPRRASGPPSASWRKGRR